MSTMSTEEEDAKMWEELDHLARKPKTASDHEAAAAFELAEVLKMLEDPDVFVVKSHEMLSARDPKTLVNQLERAADLAKEFGDPMVTLLIQGALTRLRR